MTPVTILHVEDDEADRTLFSAAFQKVAPEIHLMAVVDGAQAIAYLSGQGAHQDRDRSPLPQLVLLDLKLPKKSGLEVLDWIRNRSERRDLAVFMLTSSNDPKDQERAKALEVQEYLIKPVDLQGIREVARRVAGFVSQREPQGSTRVTA
jgi:CheY-like chemotaxis protein